MTGATAALSSVEKGQKIQVNKIVADDDADNRSTSTKTGELVTTETQHGDSIDNLYKSFTCRIDEEGFSYETAAAAAGKLGHVINRGYYNGVNPVNVTLTDDASWTVTGNSIVYNLTADSSAITAEKPVIISMKGALTLDGEKVTDDVKTVGNVTYAVTFKDIAANAWYAQAVDYVAAEGIMKGAGSTLTRAQLAQIFYNYYTKAAK